MQYDDMLVSRETIIAEALAKILKVCDDADLSAEFSEDSLTIWDGVLDLSVVFFSDAVRKEQGDAIGT